MSTSGTYSFASPQSKDIVEDAYERIGIIPTQLTQQKINAAQRTINFILQDWVNKGNNLWTVQIGMIALNQGQAAYNLPPNAIDIKTAAVRQSNRNLGGTPFSSAGGNAAFAFDNNPATACTQTAPNGYISYNWGAAQFAIAMVGVQSATTQTYTLVGEYSLDNVNWTTALTIPAQTYTQGVLQWYVVPVPTPASVFRIRETGGATLNIEELYFNTSLYDLIVTAFSEFEYTSQPYKNQPGRPTSFWVDRQINPVIYLWPVPIPPWNNLYFTYWQAIQDIGSLQNNAQIPARFLEALTAAAAYKLALKEGKLERLQVLQMEAEKSYKEAGQEDRERVPLRIYGDYTQGWTTI